MNNYTYGNWNEYGWGAAEHDEEYRIIDFDPEFETKRDVINYIKRYRNMLDLPKVTLFKKRIHWFKDIQEIKIKK